MFAGFVPLCRATLIPIIVIETNQIWSIRYILMQDGGVNIYTKT